MSECVEPNFDHDELEGRRKVGEWTLGAAMAIPILIIFGLPLMLYHAWALQTCWNWTMPQRFNLPPLDIRGAIAITITTAMLVKPETPKSEKGKAWQTLIGYLVAPILAVFIVWIVK